MIKRYNPNLIQHHRPASALVMDFLGKALKACTATGVVVSGFASTGLFPFDRDLILKHAKEFTAPALTDPAAAEASTAEDIARAITVNMLDEHAELAKAVKRRVNVSRNGLYLSEQLLAEEKERARKDKERRAAERVEAKEQKAADKAQKKRAREEQQQARQAEKEEEQRRRAEEAVTWTCKACQRRARGRHPAKWLWCDYCESYGICPYRKLCKDGPALLEQHEEEERRQGKRPLLGGERAAAV